MKKIQNDKNSKIKLIVGSILVFIFLIVYFIMPFIEKTGLIRHLIIKIYYIIFGIAGVFISISLTRNTFKNFKKCEKKIGTIIAIIVIIVASLAGLYSGPQGIYNSMQDISSQKTIDVKLTKPGLKSEHHNRASSYYLSGYDENKELTTIKIERRIYKYLKKNSVKNKSFIKVTFYEKSNTIKSISF